MIFFKTYLQNLSFLLSVGRECLFEEKEKVKGKTDLPKRIKEMYGLH